MGRRRPAVTVFQPRLKGSGSTAMNLETRSGAILAQDGWSVLTCCDEWCLCTRSGVPRRDVCKHQRSFMLRESSRVAVPLEHACCCWTYQRHCGNAGPELLLDVPAALWECRAHSYWCSYQRHCGKARARVRLTSGHLPLGDCPKERLAPTQGLEGTTPRTGRHYFLTRSGSTTSPNCLRLACPRSLAWSYLACCHLPRVTRISTNFRAIVQHWHVL